jgi:glycosyltransferase involved in cell wall biosynthesis
MRVGVDATSWANRRGYGRFARNAVSRLVELDAETTYVLYIDEQSAKSAALPPDVEQRHVRLRRAPSEAAAAGSNRGIADLVRLTLAVRPSELDAFVFPSVYTYFPVLRVPTVVGVHDTIAVDKPELTFPNRRARTLWSAKERLAVRRASRLFTVSEASRMALVDRYRLSPGRVAVVPEAPDAIFGPRDGEQGEAGLAAVGLQPGDAFFLFAGGISPHKNLGTLLDAYAALRRVRGELPPLVAVGELQGDPYLSAAPELRDQIARLGLEREVLLPGFVSDETLACLYSAATAVVLPSLAEGFGLPAVEAASCGAPTVLSDLPAHRETLGDAALYFPPTDAEALAGSLARILDDDVLRNSLGEDGRRTVARLSWERAAERLRDLIAEAATR